MGRTYKRNDLYVTHKAKSLREKRKQSRPNTKGVSNTYSTEYVEKYHKPKRD